MVFCSWTLWAHLIHLPLEHPVCTLHTMAFSHGTTASGAQSISDTTWQLCRNSLALVMRYVVISWEQMLLASQFFINVANFSRHEVQSQLVAAGVHHAVAEDFEP